MRREMNRGRVWLGAVLLALTFAVPAVAEGASAEADPGEVVRWAGEGTETCGMDGRLWPAIEGACYYPLDMARPAGKVEVARWRNGGNIETAWLTVREKEFDLQQIDFPDESYVHLSPENLARLHEDQASVLPLWRLDGPVQFSLPLGLPLEPLPEGRYFGVRREFNGEPKSRHTGTDYASPLGTAVLSVADGEVVLVTDHFFAGRSVFVHHGHGMVSMYFHLDSPSVEKGATVTRGQEVGKVGSTGRSTGPHLHLGVRWRRARVDPTPLMGDPSALPSVQ